MAKVWITHDGNGTDFSRASAFGDLVVLKSGPVNPFNPDGLYTELEAALEKFDSETDHFLPMGNVLVSSLAMVALANIVGCSDCGPSPVKLLLFDAKKRDYFARTIDL
jgi:hypothetical protein